MEIEISSVTESQSLTAMSLFLVLSSPFPLGSHDKSVHLFLGMYVPLVHNFFSALRVMEFLRWLIHMGEINNK